MSKETTRQRFSKIVQARSWRIESLRRFCTT